MPLTQPSYAVNNVQTLADLTQNQAAAVKVLFDKTGADGKTFLIALLAELAAITAAGNIGATAPSGLTGTTVQALINGLKTLVDNTVLGQIPDGTLTDIKLSYTAGQIKERVATHLVDIVSHGTILRQALINGNFDINQRVVSGTVTLTAGKYGHDRWKAGSSGCTYTFATVENVTTITITAGSLQQIIEGSNLFTGTYALSWVGTAQGKIGAGSYGASGITGNATGGTNLTIEFGIGTLSKAQFNFGSLPLPFSPKGFAQELLNCQRYCFTLIESTTANALVGIGIVATTTAALIGVNLPAIMRIPPALTVTAAEWQLSDTVNAATNATAISISTSSNSKSRVALTVTVASGLTQFRPMFLQAIGGNKIMIFDAEI